MDQSRARQEAVGAPRKGVAGLKRGNARSGYGHSIFGRGLCVVRPPLPDGRGSDFCAAVTDMAALRLAMPPFISFFGKMLSRER
ncbi:MAG: hypothetical protein MI923_09340 [Phycisphaerales bacterium]|nr:hypothetical protein [Phycisphaerales bacterium]